MSALTDILTAHRPVHDPHGHINGTVPGSVAVYDCWCGLFVNATLEDCIEHQVEAVAEFYLPIRKPISEHGVLIFQCPKCAETLEVGLHITACDEPSNTSPVTRTHYVHPVDFVGQAPHLHAEFWGHMVRCHQPDPHPYMSDTHRVGVGQPTEQPEQK